MDKKDAISELLQARAEGRPIVPFIAAGFSAGSGFPLIDDLRTYLLKVKFFIKYGIYRHTLGQPFSRQALVSDPEHHPSRYISDFGWPDINQLNVDLYNFTQIGSSVDTGNKAQKGWTDEVRKVYARFNKDPRDVRLWIDWVVHRTHDVTGDATGLELNQIVAEYSLATESKLSRWGRDRWRLETAVQHVLLEDMRLQDGPLAEAVQKKVWDLKLHPRADWSRLLMEITEGNLGLIDSLMTQLSLRYKPAMSHIVLAHLVDKLNIKLLLTINFDPYIETALLQEGLSPRVFDVGRDELPPDPAVVQEALSVVKLHGSAYSLRVGERLDYALDDATRNLVERYVPQNAIFLVIGFSGYERRMMQLIEHMVSREDHSAGDKNQDPKVIWMHWEAEENLPATLNAFDLKLRSLDRGHLLKKERLSDAGEFLLELHQRLTATLPKSRSQYLALRKRVVYLPNFSMKKDQAEKIYTTNITEERQFSIQVFFRDTFQEAEGGTYSLLPEVSAPSVELSLFVQTLKGYNTIWIDLEDHHTVAGVVTEIIDKMRVFDPDLPPLVLPLGIDSPIHATDPKDLMFRKPVRFIHRAIRRGRYALVFAALEGFGREHSSHHGLPAPLHNDPHEADRLPKRVTSLVRFLRELVLLQDLTLPDKEEQHWRDVQTIDWYCCIACDEPSPRHIPHDSEQDKIRKTVRLVLAEFVNDCKISQQRGRSVNVRPCNVSKARDLLHSDKISQHSTAPNAINKIRSELEMLVGNEGILSKALLQNMRSINSEWQKDITIVLESFISNASGQRESAEESDGSFLRPDWISKVDVPFLLLTIVRRPRSLAMILALFGEYLPKAWAVRSSVRRSWVSDITLTLQTENLLYPMTGGFYWIPHHLHEWFYKLLSEPLRTRAFLSLTKKDFTRLNKKNSTELTNILSRLVFLCTSHSRVARFYYIHIYNRSHEVSALFEFLYHRISSLKYAKLIASYMKIIDSASEKILEVKKMVAFLWQFEEVGVGKLSDSMGIDDLKDILSHIRIKFLNSIRNVFARETEAILASASSDTWLAWIDQLLRDAELMVCTESNRSVLALKFKNQFRQDTFSEVLTAWIDTDSGVQRSCRELQWFLQDLKGHILREKRAWPECVNHRLQLLGMLARRGKVHAISEEIPNGLKPPLADDNTVLSSVLNRLSSVAEIVIVPDHDFVRQSQILQEVQAIISSIDFTAIKFDNYLLSSLIQTYGVGEDTAGRVKIIFNSLMDIAACLRHQPKLPVSSSTSNSLENSVHKLATLFLESVLNESQAFESRLESEHGSSQELVRGSRNLQIGLQSMKRDLSFDIYRFRIEAYHPWWRTRHDCFGRERNTNHSIEISKIADSIEAERRQARGSEYLDLDELTRRLCQYHTLLAQALMWLEHFDDALRNLDSAENGLREELPSHRFLIVIVYCLRAQSLMRSADFDVRRTTIDVSHAIANPDYSPITSVHPANIASASVKLAEASSSLLNAERILRSVRRNIGQWRRLYHGKVQIQIEQLLLLLLSLELGVDIDTDRLRFVAKIHAYLLKGLEAVRGGWDCSLSPQQGTSDEASNDRREWVAQWLQLMFSSHLALLSYALLRQSTSLEEPMFARRKGTRLQEARDVVWSAEIARHELEEEMQDPDSFLARWVALNRSVGLERFVESPQQEIFVKALAELRIHFNDNGTLILKQRNINFISRLWNREIALAFAELHFGDWMLSKSGIVEQILDSLESDPLPTRHPHSS